MPSTYTSTTFAFTATEIFTQRCIGNSGILHISESVESDKAELVEPDAVNSPVRVEKSNLLDEGPVALPDGLESCVLSLTYNFGVYTPR